MASPFKVKLSKDVGTVATKIGDYTPASGLTAKIMAITISNNLSSTIKVDVTLQRGNVSYFIVKQVDIAVGAALVPIEGGVYLEAGDSIFVTASAANASDVTMSVMEV
jgi:hypothetical protein